MATVKIPDVDHYLELGCGRCSKYATADCKVHTWHTGLEELRRIMLESGLNEEIKWGNPTYTLKGKNVVMIAAFKGWYTLSFFKGSLLKDDHKILTTAGGNSHHHMLVKFTDFERLAELEPLLHQYVAEAIELEKSGAKTQKPKASEPMPVEISEALEQDEAFRTAWENLTPGRQRSYILHVGSAKQEATRRARIERCKPAIHKGKGHNEY